MTTAEDIQKNLELRRCILETLYACFRELPYGLVELDQIAETCVVDAQALNWNIVYLEKLKFVELDRSMDCPPYISCTAVITALGIDLVENQVEFEKKFHNFS